MNNEEKIIEILGAMQQSIGTMQQSIEKINERLDGIDERLDGIDERLDNLEEYAEVTRTGVNSLLEWAEECGNVIKFPLPKVK